MALLRRIGSVLRDAWLIVGIAAAALCLLEAGLSLAYFVNDRLKWTPDERVMADTYDNAPWPLDYYREHASIRMRWEPYVYWRRGAYRGRLIRVDEDGLRATTPTASAPSALKVFMFGGSTLWGTGVGDEVTIPSIVARELERKGVLANVTNFGQSGYVSTQELITLELELKRGRRPDLVIFYDGISDTYSAFQQGVAGLPQDEYNRVREFNLLTSDRRGDLIRNAIHVVARGLSITRLINRFRPQKSAGPAAHSFASEVGPSGSSAAAEQLARETVRIYASNLGVVKMLGAHYDFDFLAYWQPTIFDKPHLTRYESTYRTEKAPMEPFFRRTYGLIRQRYFDETQEVRDISLIFADIRIPIFVDEFHLGETGNEMVATVIVSDVLKGIAERRAPREPTSVR